VAHDTISTSKQNLVLSLANSATLIHARLVSHKLSPLLKLAAKPVDAVAPRCSRRLTAVTKCQEHVVTAGVGEEPEHGFQSFVASRLEPCHKSLLKLLAFQLATDPYPGSILGVAILNG